MITVCPVSSEQFAAAAQLLFHEQRADVRKLRAMELLEANRRGEIRLDGLLLARIDGEPVGAALFALQPDGTAFVWPPAVVSHPSREEIADALLQEVAGRIDDAGAWIGQCVLERTERRNRRRLERNGFRHLADMHYLERMLTDALPPLPKRRLESVAFDPDVNAQRFVHILERTYVGTQDCPVLNGTRTGAQALESHRATGSFHASRWKIYRSGDFDVGLLLLSDQPDQNAWELVYMGIVPQARGKGYGRDMLVCGLHEARAAGPGSVLLAVDGRNIYARRVYDGLDFVELGVRAVHARLRQTHLENQ